MERGGGYIRRILGSVFYISKLVSMCHDDAVPRSPNRPLSSHGWHPVSNVTGVLGADTLNCKKQYCKEGGRGVYRLNE